MERKKRQHLDVKRFLFVGSVLGILLGSVGSISLAAFEPGADQAAIGLADRPVRVFDPFALRTILVSDVPAVMEQVNAVRPAVFSSRPSIRVPCRPAIRSAFRPGSDS